MITRDEVRILLDHPVYDGEGNKIGEAKHVFFDDMSGRPEWVSVKTGMFGTSESFIPIRDAELVEDHLEVPYPKEKIKGAPDVDVDSHGHLSEAEEHRLYDYYGIDWAGVLRDDPKTSGEGRTGKHPGMGKAGTAGAAGRSGTAAAAGTARTPGKDRTATRTTATTGTASAAAAGTPTASGRTGAEGVTGTAGGTGARAAQGAESMTRMEEEMHVRVERRETGRARLHKYVVTEDVEQTVPVRHEEVRLVREPIAEADREAALSGAEMGEADYEITLHEERPVVETRAVPVERVRLTMEERTENETVRGRVRKERIESEGIPDATARRDDTTGRGRDAPRRGRT
ncbi:DUF2382 domain-containing protein [Streptomyces prasinopilosus]|uniref:PRC-barrel domain-containing protein n=1 Tax=Streptomyces prasinopilosus TaxID=67344 RepID=A0A1G6TWA2_9ACTN|nr:PRC and DUF2382 domain-containing protein [Streptomyces prasinopilosus]SDD32585.1 PRC-barrel domain-containing protein [Streptomyces prasinopilosus]